jgi:hypothetical protein
MRAVGVLDEAAAMRRDAFSLVDEFDRVFGGAAPEGLADQGVRHAMEAPELAPPDRLFRCATTADSICDCLAKNKSIATNSI